MLVIICAAYINGSENQCRETSNEQVWKEILSFPICIWFCLSAVVRTRHRIAYMFIKMSGKKSTFVIGELPLYFSVILYFTESWIWKLDCLRSERPEVFPSEVDIPELILSHIFLRTPWNGQPSDVTSYSSRTESSTARQWNLEVVNLHGVRGEATGQFWWVNLRERDHLEYLGIDGRINMIKDLHKVRCGAWTGLVWLMWVLATAATYLRFPYDVRDFLASWRPFSFPTRQCSVVLVNWLII